VAIVLIIVGMALIAFGAFVLVRHADRPGGSLKWLGLELSSTGAGLPVIALGIGCIVFAATLGRGGERTEPQDPVTARVDQKSGKGAASSTAVPQGCTNLDAFLAPLPADRIGVVEAGMRNVHVIGAHQPLDQPFAIVFTDGGQRIGAARVRLFRAAARNQDLYRVEVVVDAACRVVTDVRNMTRGGNPRELINWDTARIRLGEHQYEVRVGGEGSVVVDHFTRVA
jgi:hypothetical protein